MLSKESLACYFGGQATKGRIQVRRVFCALTDQNLTKESFLKQIIKGEKQMEAIIGEEKEFGMRYNFDKEILTIDHYYGYWNDHGWPQHV